MKKTTIVRALGAVGIATFVAGCGGGDSSEAGTPGGGGLPSGTPTAEQQTFETFAVAPAAGQHQLRWSLVLSTTPVTGFIVSDTSVLAASPASSGPQRSTQTAPLNLTQTLGAPTLLPSRVLKNGRILTVPPTGVTTVTTYVTGAVQVDSIASDGVTVAISQRRSGFTSVPLTGTLGTAPVEFQRWHSAFYENATILNLATPFVTGAAYLKYTARAHGDRHLPIDCAGTTTSAAPSPCLSGVTLSNALAGGQLPVALSAGTLASAEGVPMWIANTALPVATVQGTPAYRMYFELNGSIYMGNVIRDNTVLYGNVWWAPSTGLGYVPYQIRLNKGAHDTLAAGIRL